MIKFRWEKEFKETPIGKIPKDWEIKKVHEIGDVWGGTTPSTKIKEYWDGDIAWITPKDLANYDKKYITKGQRSITELAVKRYSMKIFPPGTVLLTSRAPIGYVAIAGNYVTTNQGFRNIIPKDFRTSEYLYYLFKVLKHHLENIAGGSTFPELSGGTLKQVEIPYPSPDEQQRIATVLSWFDDLIENKRRQNEILEKVAMAIFKSWFIDFEPFQDEEFVYSEELDMEVPKGWEVKPIGEVAEFTNGLSYKGSEKFSEYVDGSYVFITLNNINEGGGFKPEYAWIKSTRLKQRHFLKEGNLIFANTEQTKSGRLLGSPAFVIFPPEYGREGCLLSSHN